MVLYSFRITLKEESEYLPPEESPSDFPESNCNSDSVNLCSTFSLNFEDKNLNEK